MNNLWYHRRMKGLKQYQLASKLGVSASLLSLIETGRQEPTDEFKLKCSRELKIPIKELFPNDENPLR